MLVCLCACGFPRVCFSSQADQARILNALFDAVGVTNRFYVEFAGYNTNALCSGSGSNTCELHRLGWQGLLLDGGHENASINLRLEMISSANIVHLFDKYHVPHEVDYVRRSPAPLWLCAPHAQRRAPMCVLRVRARPGPCACGAGLGRHGLERPVGARCAPGLKVPTARGESAESQPERAVAKGRDTLSHSQVADRPVCMHAQVSAEFNSNVPWPHALTFPDSAKFDVALKSDRVHYGLNGEDRPASHGCYVGASAAAFKLVGEEHGYEIVAVMQPLDLFLVRR